MANNVHGSGEEKPACLNCQRQGEPCDYSVRLNWGGRTKRLSIDSPSSPFNGSGGTVIGFSDSFAVSNVGPISFPTPASYNADGLGNTHVGDLASLGGLSPNALAPVGLFDSPRFGSESEEVTTPDQLKPQFNVTWAEQITPLTTSVSSQPLSQYQLGYQSLESPSFISDIDQISKTRDFSPFAFHSNPVSQTVSYLRHSVETSDHHCGPENLQSRDDRHLPLGSRSGHGMAVDTSETGQEASSHSSQNTNRLSGILLGSRKVSNEILSSNACKIPNIMESRHDYHHETTPTHQVLAESNRETDQISREATISQKKWKMYLNSVTDNYGLDAGRSDQDLTLNNDHAAIDINYALDSISSRWRNQETSYSPIPQSVSESKSQFCGGYYASPVPINVPRYLSPLPSSLLENPINLMYFHHFLNHTARMLVPHDCDQNPFISVLPSSKSVSFSASYLGRS